MFKYRIIIRRKVVLNYKDVIIYTLSSVHKHKFLFNGGDYMEEGAKLKLYERSSKFIDGVKVGIPIAIGYIPIAITFGLISKSSGIPDFISIIMSITVFAGASQFIGVNLIASGATAVEIIMTTFILNFRHFLMSSSLSQRIENNTEKKLLSVIAFGITDETFAVASLRKEDKINPWIILGLNFMAYISWILGTCVGVFIGDALPETLKSSMGIALYSMFIGLLVPELRNSKPVLFVALVAILVSCLLKWIPIFSFISTGWSVIISTVVGAFMGAIFCGKEEK